jgi:hypothetical protein
MKLPKAEQQKRHWQTAAEVVLMAAEDRGPMMHAHIGMLQAVERRQARSDYHATSKSREEVQGYPIGPWRGRETTD